MSCENEEYNTLTKINATILCFEEKSLCKSFVKQDFLVLEEIATLYDANKEKLHFVESFRII